MDKQTIQLLGDELYQSLITGQVIDPLTSRYTGITINDGYQIQSRLVGRRIEKGARVVGKKIGVTSRVVMNMLGVNQPDFGILLDDMIYNEGEAIEYKSLIQPKAEGEIAFVMKKDLMGPGVTGADVLAATEGVIACFEIVDSRIRDWKIKVQDTVADNASCGVMVLGDQLVDVRKVDLMTCGMLVERNGEIVGTGSGAATMASPVNAIAWLANTLGALGIPLKAGEIVLSGSLAAMFPIAAGDNFRVTIGGIGSCSVRFV